MTDKDKLINLLTEFGVDFSINNENGEEVSIVECYEGDTGVIGYSGFWVGFMFNLDDSFKQIGIWE